VLNSAKPAKKTDHWLTRFKMIVGAILAIETPLSALVLAKLLDQPEGTIKTTLANLHSILAPSGEGSDLIYKVHHKSLPDYITGLSCPSEFQMVEKDLHLQLVKCCLKVMNKQLRFNVCQISLKDQYQNLDTLLKEGLDLNCISKELQYAARYWTNHLSKLQDIDSELTELLEAFSKEHFMHWIEVLALIDQLDAAHPALKKAADTLVRLNLDNYVSQIFTNLYLINLGKPQQLRLSERDLSRWAEISFTKFKHYQDSTFASILVLHSSGTKANNDF
jgi:hypothetical protein